MATQKIRLTESELYNIIVEQVNEALQDEGFLNQLKQGTKSFFGNGYRADNDYRNTTADRQSRGEHTANFLNGSTPMNLKGRWNAAKTGFQQQGHIDNADKIRNELDNLEQLLASSFDQNTLNKMTIGQLKSRLGGAKGAAMSRIRGANNAIYKGQNVGVMGSGRTEQI